MNSCKKFGVTFHKNMDLKTLVNQWSKVTQEVKDANPEMNQIMQDATTLLQTQQTTITATSTAKEIFNDATDAVAASAAILTGNFAYIGAKASSVVADETQQAENTVVKTQEEVIYAQLCS